MRLLATAATTLLALGNVRADAAFNLFCSNTSCSDRSTVVFSNTTRDFALHDCQELPLYKFCFAEYVDDAQHDKDLFEFYAYTDPKCEGKDSGGYIGFFHQPREACVKLDAGFKSFLGVSYALN